MDDLAVVWRAEEDTAGRTGASHDTVGCRFVEVAWPSTPARGRGRLTVRLGGASVDFDAEWGPSVDPHVSVADLELAPTPDAASDEGATDGGLTALSRLAIVEERLQSFPAGSGPWLHAKKASLLFDLGRRQAAIDARIAAADAALSLGLPSMAVEQLAAAAHYSHFSSGSDRYVRTVGLIARAGSIARTNDDPIGLSRVDYLAGRVDIELGRLLPAAQALRSASQQAARLGERRLAIGARDQWVRTQAMLGHHLAAERNSRAVVDEAGALGDDMSPEDVIQLTENALWARMDAVSAGEMPRVVMPDIRARLGALVARADRLAIDVGMRANLRIDAARAAMMVGDLSDARALLGRAMELSEDGGGFDPAYVALLRAEVALVGGDSTTALAIMAEQAQIPFAHCDRYRGWTLAILARGLRMQGHGITARVLADAALAHGWRWAGVLPTGIGEPSATWRPALVDAVELALAAGRPDDALRAIEHVRAAPHAARATQRRLAKLSDADAEAWARRVAELRAICQRRDDGPTASDGDEDDPIERAAAWLESASSDPPPPQRPADVAHLLPPDVVLFSMSRVGDRWHAFRVADGRVEHRGQASPALPDPWIAAALGRRGAYVIDEDGRTAADAERRLVDSVPVSRLPRAAVLASRYQAGPSALVQLADPCEAAPIDVWSLRVHVGSGPIVELADVAHHVGPWGAILAPCDGMTPTAVRSLAGAMVDAGAAVVLTSDHGLQPAELDGISRRARSMVRARGIVSMARTWAMPGESSGAGRWRLHGPIWR